MALYRSRISASFIVSVLAVIALIVLVNCRPDVPFQGWSGTWGPLVPHHTFPGDCGMCHIPDRWDVLRDDFSFDHERETGYALEGAHADAVCLRCHNDRGPVTAYVSRGCGGCHPDPHASSMGLECERCHNQMSWEASQAVVDHARTRFPLYGAHAVAPCETCHTAAAAGRFDGAATQCDLCHQADLAQATSPDHAANGWTIDCERCHTATAWTRLSFPHDIFPLSGGHAGLDCTACHTSGVVGVIPADCYSCHSTDYTAATNHVAHNYPQTCEQCHRTTTWTSATYAHSGLPLTGGHSGLDCIQCHTGGTFGPIPSDCYDCHASDYSGTADHVSQSFPQACEQCHDTTGWTPVTYDHSGFVLTGGHGGLNCTQCHTGGTFGTIPSDCYSCHSTDYTGAADHVSLNFPHACETCHSSTAWTPASYDHSVFALTGGHSGLLCTQCHTSGTFGTIPSDCYDCHASDYSGAADHTSQGFPQTCEACHSTTAWTPTTYDHTGFALTGGHGGLLCTQCHTGGRFATIPSDCYSCHSSDYTGAPDHVSLDFPQTCEQCHGTMAWTPASYDHSAFPLTGGHGGLLCTQCHTSGTFGTIPSDCYSCHSADYSGAPDHTSQGFPQTCEQCHSTTAWTPTTYDHSGFALTGGHGGLLCTQCHTGGSFGTIPSDCHSCHSTDYAGAADHTSQGFPQTCEQCHSTTAWTPTTYDHTGLPLTGGHSGLLCTQCHTDGTFGTIPSDCYSCHESDYTGAPDHVSSSYPYTCEQCHSSAAWLPATLDHSGFALTGGHSGLLCTQCHTSGTFGTIPSDCYSCHSADYTAAADHTSQGFPQTCEQCHSTTAWTPTTYDHSSFPLTNGHGGLLCTQCHTGGTFGTIPSDCYSCHAADYSGAATVNHVSQGFPKTCEQCHTTIAWTPTTYDHSGFLLTGGHSGLLCTQCHTGGTFGTIPSDCYSCHSADYTAAANHTSQGFPQTCEQCHSTAAWTPTTFDHSAFALTGGHGGLLCTQCHTSGTFGTIPSDCYSCHAADYSGAATVNHVSQGFPQTCEQCHDTTAWKPTTYDHSGFALTGGHSGLLCTQCHTGGTFGTIPSDCYACHAADYSAAATVNHVSQGFPQTCEQCHTTIAWAPTTYDHSGFPLTDGHSGLLCTQCHTGGMFQTIPSDCYSCHSDDYTGASNHVGESYPQTCQTCHSTTAWTPATYDHSTFPLTGGHAGLNCTRCHTGGTFGPIPSDCYSCHASNYAGAANHSSLNLSHSCEQCHTTIAWMPSTFVHGFSLSGVHNVSCDRCHTTGDASVYTCAECHPGGAPDD